MNELQYEMKCAGTFRVAVLDVLTKFNELNVVKYSQIQSVDTRADLFQQTAVWGTELYTSIEWAKHDEFVFTAIECAGILGKRYGVTDAIELCEMHQIAFTHAFGGGFKIK